MFRIFFFKTVLHHHFIDDVDNIITRKSLRQVLFQKNIKQNTSLKFKMRDIFFYKINYTIETNSVLLNLLFINRKREDFHLPSYVELFMYKTSYKNFQFFYFFILFLYRLFHYSVLFLQCVYFLLKLSLTIFFRCSFSEFP